MTKKNTDGEVTKNTLELKKELTLKSHELDLMAKSILSFPIFQEKLERFKTSSGREGDHKIGSNQGVVFKK